VEEYELKELLARAAEIREKETRERQEEARAASLDVEDFHGCLILLRIFVAIVVLFGIVYFFAR